MTKKMQLSLITISFKSLFDISKGLGSRNTHRRRCSPPSVLCNVGAMNNAVEQEPHQTEHDEEEEEEDIEESCSSDSEIGDALDWLDSKDQDDFFDGSFTSSLSAWRPNAHGGHHSHSSTLQPLANRNQKFTHHIRASPLEVPF